jgi:hypothetical protein
VTCGLLAFSRTVLQVGEISKGKRSQISHSIVRNYGWRSRDATGCEVQVRSRLPYFSLKVFVVSCQCCCGILTDADTAWPRNIFWSDTVIKSHEQVSSFGEVGGGGVHWFYYIPMCGVAELFAFDRISVSSLSTEDEGTSCFFFLLHLLLHKQIVCTLYKCMCLRRSSFIPPSFARSHGTFLYAGVVSRRIFTAVSSRIIVICSSHSFPQRLTQLPAFCTPHSSRISSFLIFCARVLLVTIPNVFISVVSFNLLVLAEEDPSFETW